MNISFLPLMDLHLVQLLKWLVSPHVKTWWDKDVNYTENLVKEKYASYINGYKLENGLKKSIYSFMIYIDNDPVGYIQIYNAYDFNRNKSLVDLPSSLAAIDFFIGNTDYLGLGLGVEILKAFDFQGYKNVIVGPDMDNIAAIKTYKKAGFEKIREYKELNEILMLKENEL